MTFQREHDGHLSAFKVSRVASGALEAHERASIDVHLASCATCAARVQAERADVQAALLEPVPARVLAAKAPAKTPWWSSWKLWVPGLVAVAAAILIVVLPQRSPPENDDDYIRTKGAVAIEATVARGDAIAVADSALASLGALQAGDKLLLRVRGGEGLHARVESFEGGAWVEVHRSVVPAEGWLPLALTVTPGETRLRVAVCADEALTDCFEQAHTLDVK